MSIYDRPADDVKVVKLADLSEGPYSFKADKGSHAICKIESAGGGVLACRVKAKPNSDDSTERVLTVTAGEEIPLFIEAILDETTVAVDGYSIGTTTDVAQIRGYLWD